MKDIKTFLDYLENIEYVFPEDAYVEGELLFDENKLKVLEQNKNNWQFQAPGRPKNIVNIKLNSKKLNNHSCSCNIYKTNGLCKHIVASYLWTRKTLLNLSETIEDKPVVKKKRLQPRNQVRDLLNKVSHEELVSFLSSYIKTDKKLNTAISVHFLSKTNNTSKSDFKLILDKIIQPVTKANQKVSASDWSLFFKTVDNMLLQAKDASSISKFDFAVNILIALIDKLYYVYSKFEQNQTKVLDRVKSANEVLKYSMDLIEAPLRKENYFKKFKEIILKSYFNNYLSFDFVHIFLDNDIIPINTKQQLAERYRDLSSDSESKAIHTRSMILRLLNDDQKLQSAEFDKLDKTLIKPVLLEILEEGDLSSLKSILNSNDSIEKSIKYELDYEIAKIENDHHQISKRLLKLIQLNRQIKHYELLKNHCELHNDIKSLKEAREIILEWPDELKLDYFHIELEFDELINALIRLNDLDYHFEYSPLLPDDYFGDIVDLYFSTASSFLEEHVGRTTANYVQDLVNKLYKIHNPKIVSEFLTRVDKAYGDRKSIENLLKTLS